MHFIKTFEPPRHYLGGVIIRMCDLNGITTPENILFIRIIMLSIISVTPLGYIVYLLMFAYIEKYDQKYQPPYPYRDIITRYGIH